MQNVASAAVLADLIDPVTHAESSVPALSGIPINRSCHDQRQAGRLLCRVCARMAVSR
jgi:hypothetical protein